MEGVKIKDSFITKENAEKVLLGELLLKPEVIEIVSEELQPEMFTNSDYKIIYKAMLELHANAKIIELLLVLEQLKKNWNYDEETIKKIVFPIVEDIPNAINLMDNVYLINGKYKIVKEKKGKVTIEKIYNKNGVLLRTTPYEKGVREGLETEYYIYSSSKKIKITRNYKNNKITGIETTYSPSGSIKKEVEYSEGIKNGFCKEYYENKESTLKSEVNYINNMAEGNYNCYFHNGALKETVNFVSNKKEGAQKHFDKKGLLLLETNYIENVKEGVEKHYDETGEVYRELGYEKGIVDHETEYSEVYINNLKVKKILKTYYQEGLKLFTIAEKDGYFDYYSYYEFYDYLAGGGDPFLWEDCKKNHIARKGYYNHSLDPISTHFFYKDGILSSSVEYDKNGLKDGIEKVFNKNKKVVKTTVYFKGITKKLKRFRNNEQLWLDCNYLPSGELKSSVSYYKNGQIASEILYKNSKPEGVARIYYESKKVCPIPLILLAEIVYKDGKKTGHEKKYWENGNLKKKTLWLDGLILNVEEYYIDGKIAYENSENNNNSNMEE